LVSKDLYNKVLIEPTITGANILYIVSGYATPAIAFRHLSDISNSTIKLIVGMTAKEGIGKNAHNEFIKLMTSIFPGRFECYYVKGNIPVHTKAYGWFSSTEPLIGYVGSANYSQNAFFENQGESMALEAAENIKLYFDSLLPHCIICTHEYVGHHIPIYDENLDKPFRIASSDQYSDIIGESFSDRTNFLSTYEDSIVLTLLTQGQDKMPEKSGLNWGQRPNREHNQAYIALPSNIYNSDFFPEPGHKFNLITDDGFVFSCVRAQANGKAIETPENNSILGRYFRQRIGVPLGNYVSIDDMLRYGRTNIKVTKISNSSYFMDFSV
jgi:hypothetical protein